MDPPGPRWTPNTESQVARGSVDPASAGHVALPPRTTSTEQTGRAQRSGVEALAEDVGGRLECVGQRSCVRATALGEIRGTATAAADTSGEFANH